jgi:type II secretory pathway pseudopilin PulG
MIVVALIGVLSAVAIPSFLRYQARARRTEGFSNLSSIARAQKSYYAEQGFFFEVAPFPNPGGLGENLSAVKQAWTGAAEAAFANLGWSPDGQVYFSYDSNTGATGCACGESCFTATAYGDVDADDVVSGIMYVEPLVDKSTGAVLVECPSHMFGFGTPLRGGAPVYHEAALNKATDDF